MPAQQSDFGTFTNDAVGSAFVSQLNVTNTMTPKTSALWSKFATKAPIRHYDLQTEDIETGALYQHRISILSVTLPAHLTAASVAALAYSFLPFVIFIGFLTTFVVYEAAVALYAMVLTAFLSVVCEFYLKRVFKEPRPQESAVKSYGMPSSHCVTAYALMTWIVLDVAFSAEALTTKLIWVFVTILALAPIPWARCQLKDHTPKQCVMGCSGGTIAGSLAFLLRFCLLPPAFA